LNPAGVTTTHLFHEVCFFVSWVFFFSLNQLNLNIQPMDRG